MWRKYYECYKFKSIGDYRLIACNAPLTNISIDKNIKDWIPSDIKIENYSDLFLTKLSEYDFHTCNYTYDRSLFLKNRLTCPGTVTKVFF